MKIIFDFYNNMQKSKYSETILSYYNLDLLKIIAFLTLFIAKINSIMVEEIKSANPFLIPSVSKSESFSVICRVRPMSKKEIEFNKVNDLKDGNGNIVTTASQSVSIKYGEKDDSQKIFTFDAVYDYLATNEKIYEEQIKPNIMQGFAHFKGSAFILYGQTGTGRNHTLIGTKDDLGILNRTCKFLLEQSSLKFVEMELSCIEIYNEKIRDILTDQELQKELKLKQNTETGKINVEDLSKMPIKSYSDIENAISIVESNKTVQIYMGSAPAKASYILFYNQNYILLYTNSKLEIKFCIYKIEGKKDGKKVEIVFILLQGSERTSKTLVVLSCNY